MENYLLFLIVAIVTVLSPGPGVILTLTNTIRFGVSGAVGGILGIAEIPSLLQVSPQQA